jgi:chitinase
MTGLAVIGATAFGVVQANSASAALSNNWYAAAPYLMPFDNDPPNALEVMNATGLKAFQLAFILAPNAGGCSPTWDGTRAVSSDTAASALIGTKLGQACGSPAATAAAYQQVISKYNLKAIDFDLEEPEYENGAAIHNEIGAAKILQQSNSGLFVSVTTAGTAAGTGFFGQAMLNEAKAAGFTPANFSIMPFDGGFTPSGQISALEAFHGVLMNTFGWDSGTAYAHEGASLMNGQDDGAAPFPQSSFESVLSYATSHRLGRMTFWSVNRDRQCANPNQTTTSGVCSSVHQTPWEFTKFSVRFAGATPPVNPPTGGPTTPPPGGGSCNAAPWTASGIFTAGMMASDGGHLWKAKWWTQGEKPPADVWADQGPCSGGSGGGPSTPPPGNGGACSATLWTATAVFTGGMTASFGGHNWTAKWWTQGDTPGANSQNVWTDNGSC